MYVAFAYVGSSVGVTVGNSVRVTTSKSANVGLSAGVTLNARASIRAIVAVWATCLQYLG